ncbi:deoxyguanosinetriphosphate triphosphohydrolase [Pseudokineococcus sp. 1T1Z-3]|uniref:deoxyguanosinetriphosphate triphosphohydrolase n=1 Tax=Pseudokineococcus sp. 1T1Z-3 TaxID=3132745 RepID=UPI0030A60876
MSVRDAEDTPAGRAPGRPPAPAGWVRQDDARVPGYSEHARARHVPEAPKSAARGDFARDRARVLHSSALRRLGGKTQVVGPGSDDFVRTRLTHSLEVAQVGRELASSFGCDPDVVETACLAHDLGHPPFGHNGERALAEAAAGIGGFEGNAQTLRLLTRLEPKVVDLRTGRSGGLNLTRASLDAVVKYPWHAGQAPGDPAGPAAGKYGVYGGPDGDDEVFTWLREDAPARRRCLEAQVMDLADDIAYSVHDVEDAVVAGRLDLGVVADPGQRALVAQVVARWHGVEAASVEEGLLRLAASPEWVGRTALDRAALAALKDMTSQLVGRFVDAARRATHAAHGRLPLVRYDADVVVPEETLAEIAALKGLSALFVVEAGDRQPVYVHQRELLAELVDALCSRGPEVFEPAYAADLAAADGDDARLRVVVDQVAALTDVSAAAWHERLVR